MMRLYIEEMKHNVRRENGNNVSRLRYMTDYKERLRMFATAWALGAHVVTATTTTRIPFLMHTPHRTPSHSQQ